MLIDKESGTASRTDKKCSSQEQEIHQYPKYWNFHPVVFSLSQPRIILSLESESRSVVSNSLWPHGLYSPWNSLGQNSGVDSLSLLQMIFPNQGLNPGLPHCRWILYQLSHEGSFPLVVSKKMLIALRWTLSHKTFLYIITSRFTLYDSSETLFFQMNNMYSK